MWKLSFSRLLPAFALLIVFSITTADLATAQLTLLPPAESGEVVPLAAARRSQQAPVNPVNSDSRRSTLKLRPVALPGSPPRPIESETKRQAKDNVSSDAESQNAEGPCVLLKNDNVLFGDAVQVGQLVVVKTGSGGEVRLPRTQVACWSDSLRHLYRYRIDHRLGNDINSHLRDARWCLRYDLLDLAANELRAVYRLDPDNRQAALIEERMRRRVESQDSAPLGTQEDGTKERDEEESDTQTTPSGHTEKDIQPVQYQSEASSPASVTRASITNDPLTLRRFASHIQPLLMNRCGNCHSEHPTGEAIQVQWLLTKPTPGARPSAEMTRANLESIAPYLDLENLPASELMSKATQAHGGGEAPLGRSHSKAIVSLAQWMRLAANRREVKDDHQRPATSVRQRETTPTQQPVFESAPEEAPPLESSSQPARLPQVADPFDPELFNRRFHRD